MAAYQFMDVPNSNAFSEGMGLMSQIGQGQRQNALLRRQQMQQDRENALQDQQRARGEAFRQTLAESVDEEGQLQPETAFTLAKERGLMPEMVQFTQAQQTEKLKADREERAMTTAAAQARWQEERAAQLERANTLRERQLEQQGSAMDRRMTETERHQRALEAQKDRATAVTNVPETDPMAPWRHINDPKKRDEAKTRFGIESDKLLAKEQEDVEKAKGVNQALDRFTQLNETTSTGPVYDMPIIGGIAKTASSFDPNFREMQSLQDRLTPAMRQGMPGAASDRDVAMFQSATVGVGKDKTTNKNVALGLKVANQNQNERFQFMNEYVADKGHLRGAEQEWKSYLNANPIFDPTKPEGSYALNQNRRSYADWKAGGQSSAPVQPTAPKKGAIDGGYVFMGGDPSDKNNWKKAK